MPCCKRLYALSLLLCGQIVFGQTPSVNPAADTHSVPAATSPSATPDVSGALARLAAMLAASGQRSPAPQAASQAPALAPAGSLAQIASAGGWDTTFTLINLGATSSAAQLNFFANDGSALQLPLTALQQNTPGVTAATFGQNLAPNASLLLDTTGPSSVGQVGSGQILAGGSVDGFAIFTVTATGQAAVVPLETRNAGSYLLAFDNTGSVSTGLAIANISSTAVAVGVIIRDDTGAQVGTASIRLAAQGHNDFVLTDPTYGFPATAGIRGTLEFDTPAGAQIGVLGLRANTISGTSGIALTTLPVLANVGTGGGTLAHLASGGGWQTTFTLVNTGSTPATANLNFYGDDGAAELLPLSFPQTGATLTATSVSRSIPVGGSLIVNLQDSGATTLTGSAVLTTTGNVGGFGIFRYNPSSQEAVVPLETVNAPSYVLAFDNTGTIGTGLAIANNAAQAANVNVIVRDDTGAQIGQGFVGLPAQGHTSFMLASPPQGFPQVPAGKRGTIEFDTPAGGQIAPLGLRAGSISGGFTMTTIPAFARGYNGGSAVAERALSQTGLSIALASNVLQSQLQVMFLSGGASNPCTSLSGGGSVASGATPITMAGGSPLYPVTLYYDTSCTQQYITGDITSAAQLPIDGGAFSETATYFSPTGTTLGAMTLNVTVAFPDSGVQLYGLGSFIPSGGARTPVLLGLSCNIANYGSGALLTVPCTGAVAQNFPALSLAVGAATPLELTIPEDASGNPTSVTFQGGGSTVTGALGGLSLTNPTPSTFAFPGGTPFTTTTAGGGAAAFSLFPPTPTGWTLIDATHDEQLQINVIDNITRALSLAITQMSTGTTLVTATIDQSGTGTINYSDGSKSAITSWTLAD